MSASEEFDPGIHGAVPAVPQTPKPLIEDASGDTAFEVQFGVGGPIRSVPAGVSLLNVLLEAGADVMFSCREGTCASCRTTLLEGVADHRDHVLTASERASGDSIFPCVSRALSPRLVLDLELPDRP